ncbi:MAG TPA: hypothetical protein VNM90_16035 [Haliangium sp.]|nr:hypothetical protein [Haliangium sp.]
MKRLPVFAIVVLTSAITWVSCDERQPARQGDQPAAAVTTAPSSKEAAPAAAPVMDQRTQYDLAKEIAAAEAMPRNEAGLRLPEIRRDWIGKRYQWEVGVIPAFCASIESCHVLPFEIGAKDRHIVQGWLPRLEVTQDGFAAIQSACKGAERCRIEFRGTLSKLVLSTEELTSLGFSDVEIL